MNRTVRLILVLALSLILGLNLRVPGLGAHGSIPLAGPAAHGFPAGTLRTYRTGADIGRLLPINPHSLADLSNPAIRTRLRPEGNQYPSVVATSDGSKFVVMENLHPNNQVIRRQDLAFQLFNARTGNAMTSLQHPAGPVWISGISVDGSVVYGFRTDSNNVQPCTNSNYYFLDSRTGRVLQHATIAASASDPVVVGPNQHRIYIMTSSDHLHQCGPHWAYSPIVTAYDVQTGRVVRSTRLKGIPAGLWNTNRTLNGDPIGANWNPGFALSPDGSQIAVVDGHNDTLTLLRASTLQVEAKERLVRLQTGFSAFAAVLGLQTPTADAKGQENGAYLQVQYTPDGRHLLETGALLPSGQTPSLFGFASARIATD